MKTNGTQQQYSLYLMFILHHRSVPWKQLRTLRQDLECTVEVLREPRV